jgi:hypothetical protein
VAAADELLMTWVDDPEGMTRDRVVDVVMLMFDATAHHISSLESRSRGGRGSTGDQRAKRPGRAALK